MCLRHVVTCLIVCIRILRGQLFLEYCKASDCESLFLPTVSSYKFPYKLICYAYSDY